MPREALLEQLRRFRSEGVGAKAIARGLGYSADHIYKLCARYGIGLVRLKPNVDLEQMSGAGETSRGTLRPEET